MIESKDKAESTEKILAAAVRLFAKKGYKSTSLEEVALSAGFTKGAVYYHFKSKEQLLLRVLQDIEKRSIDRTSAEIAAGQRTPTEQLRTFVRSQTAWAARHPDDLVIMILISIESANHQSKIQSQMTRMYQKIADQLEHIIIEGKRSGEFTTDQDTLDIVMYLIAIHDGNMMLWHRSGTSAEIGRKLTRATLSGFEHAVRAGGGRLWPIN